VTVAEDTVTVPTVAVIVSGKLPVFPMRTFPKLSEPGLALSCVIPVPLSETNVGVFVAVLTKEICPETPPADDGVNFAV